MLSDTLDRLVRRWRYLVEQLRARWFRFQLRRGKRTYGRQGPPKPEAASGDGMGVKGKGSFTIAAVITRADGRVEDLGVIARGATDGNRSHE